MSYADKKKRPQASAVLPVATERVNSRGATMLQEKTETNDSQRGQRLPRCVRRFASELHPRSDDGLFHDLRRNPTALLEVV